MSKVSGAGFARKLLKGRGTTALFDQIVVGGTNFLTSVVLVRGLGLATFGKYALAYAVFLYVNDMQRDPLTVPMFSIGTLMKGKEREDFLHGVFGLQLAVSTVVFFLAIVVGAVFHLFSNLYTSTELLAFACCLSVYQLQDWVRRFYFLTLRGPLAIANDLISYLGQLILLLVLWHFGKLTLLSTFLAMGVTSVAGALMILFSDRMRPGLASLRDAWRRCRTFSLDIMITTQVRWLGFQGIVFIGNAIIGTAATGGLRAVANLSGPVNVMSTAMDNFFPVRLGEEIVRGGTRAAFRFIRKSIFFSGCIFALILLPIAIFGRQILLYLYGSVMVAFYLPLILELVNVMVAAMGRLSFQLYRALQETSVMKQANIASALSIFLSIYPLSKRFGPAGVITSGLLGQLINLVYAIVYWRMHRERLLAKKLVFSSLPEAEAIPEPM